MLYSRLPPPTHAVVPPVPAGRDAPATIPLPRPSVGFGVNTMTAADHQGGGNRAPRSNSSSVGHRPGNRSKRNSRKRSRSPSVERRQNVDAQPNRQPHSIQSTPNQGPFALPTGCEWEWSNHYGRYVSNLGTNMPRNDLIQAQAISYVVRLSKNPNADIDFEADALEENFHTLSDIKFYWCPDSGEYKVPTGEELKPKHRKHVGRITRRRRILENLRSERKWNLEELQNTLNPANINDDEASESQRQDNADLTDLQRVFRQAKNASKKLDELRRSSMLLGST